ncbi:MAG: histidine kinase [Muricoprocola sp.]
MKKREKHFGESISIKQKMDYLTGMIMSFIVILTLMEFWVLRFSLVDFHEIMQGNSLTYGLEDALKEEITQFSIYVRQTSDSNKQELDLSIANSQKRMEDLPYDHEKQSEEIYRITWNIRNAYEVYVKRRDALLRQGDSMPNYISELYAIYDMQDYLIEYVNSLERENAMAGNETYYEKSTWLMAIPIIIIFVFIFTICFWLRMFRMMNHTIVRPLEELAQASKKIADNEFFIDDICFKSQDEIGELVQSFNKMKNAMGNYAQTVEENRAAREKIHEQELERIEMQRQLEAAKMDALVKQMNPHFLFNTLNMIAGMANLENADITEKMTRSLSTLLRYTVNNDMHVVPLKREMDMVEQYTYLQHMRFGARIRFVTECNVDVNRYEIPPFTLQPLVENAVIHGISPKIEGGKIRIKVWENNSFLFITVADNGVGIPKEQLDIVREGLRTGRRENIGIAMINISKRMKSLYPSGKIEIFSKVNVGTVIRISIPKEEVACIEY